MRENSHVKTASIQPAALHYQDDEIDLRDLFFTIWAGKWLIVSVTFIFAVVGMLYALQKPDVYQATVLLAPTEKSGGPQFGGQLEGLASLAGVNLGADSSSKTIIAKEVLQSRAFLADLIRRHELAVPLFAATDWNKENNSWVYDTETYNPSTRKWAIDDEGNSLAPTDWDLVEKFRQAHLSVSLNKDNGMITVSVKSLSPPAAKQWADWVVHDINEHMRTQDIKEAEARIEFLQNKLNETEIAGMQKVLYQMVEAETRTVMLANAQKEYVFRTIDPAVIPQEKSEPKRALIAIVSTFIGGLLGVFAALLREFLKKEDKNDTNGTAITKA